MYQDEDAIMASPYGFMVRPTANSMILVKDFDENALSKLMSDVELRLSMGATMLLLGIDSYGGDAYACLGMMDYLNDLKRRGIGVFTVNLAKAFSAGAFLFSCGEQRWMAPHSLLLLHEVQVGGGFGFSQPSSSQFEDAEHGQKLYKMLATYFVENLGVPKEEQEAYIEKIIPRKTDKYYTAQEALEVKIATHIGLPHLSEEVTQSVIHYIEPENKEDV